MRELSLLWWCVGLVAFCVWLGWVRAAIARWWRNRWRSFKHTIVRAPIDFPVWLWRRMCLLFVPGWLTDRDFYLTKEWRLVAAENKREYGSRCVVCTVSNAELPSGSALHSHHVRKRLTHPWLALSKSNLAPLCPGCHRLVESGKIRLRRYGGMWRTR